MSGNLILAHADLRRGKPVEISLQSRFLQGLQTTEVKTVLGAGVLRHFPSSSIIVNQEDPATRLFLVASGSARYFFHTAYGRKLMLLTLGPGEIFGGSALLDEPATYLCGVETTNDTRTLYWDREVIRRLVRQFPLLLSNALSIATDYLVWYVATHVALTCGTARERVAQVLFNLATGLGRRKRPNGIVLHITNEELANASNVTLFTASRLLARWHREGAISKHRGRIVLRHPDRLFSGPSIPAS